MLDEAHEIEALDGQQADFYSLIFRIIPHWEKMLTDQPDQANHMLHHPTHQVGTFEWIGDTTLHAALDTMCRLRRESQETAFEEVERRLADEGATAARAHLTAIAMMEHCDPARCCGSLRIVSAACFAASWYGREGEDHAPSLTLGLNLTAILETRYKVREYRKQFQRSLITSNMAVALGRQAPRDLSRHVMVLIASYCV